MIKKFQNDVESFNRRMGLSMGTTSDLFVLRSTLLKEESDEVLDAIRNRDMIETIHELCDLLYVSVGAPITFGFDLSFYLPTVNILDPSAYEAVTCPVFYDAEHCIDLIEKAAGSALVALEDERVSCVVPSLIGLVAVTCSVAAMFMIPLVPFWDEVQRSNMDKIGGTKRQDGKILKPVGWRPPDLARVYQDLYGRRP